MKLLPKLALIGSLVTLACTQTHGAESTQHDKVAQNESARPVDKGFVARAQFTTAMVEREPSDNVVVLSNQYTQVFFFTELRNLKGKTVKHRWEYNGKIMAEVSFNISSNRWRTYSSKNLDPNWLGTWTVVVTDGEGWPLKATIFEYSDKDKTLITP